MYLKSFELLTLAACRPARIAAAKVTYLPSLPKSPQKPPDIHSHADQNFSPADWRSELLWRWAANALRPWDEIRQATSRRWKRERHRNRSSAGSLFRPRLGISGRRAC